MSFVPKILLCGQMTEGSGHSQDAHMLSRVLNLLGYPHEYLNKSQLIRYSGTHQWGAVILIGNITQIAEFHHKVQHHLGNLPIAAYAHWELPNLPTSHALPKHSVHLFAPSRFAYEAYKKAGYEVTYLPPALKAFSEVTPRVHTTNTFQVMCVANLHTWPERKNVLASVRAFLTAFPKERDVHLFLKLSKLHANPEYARQIAALVDSESRITVCEDRLDAKTLHARYRESQVYLSLHRSEGFGYTIAEAMLAHLPVVATSWSGSQDLMTLSAFGAVDYNLIALTEDQYPGWNGQYWADPSVDHAASILRQLYGMPADSRDDLAQSVARELRKIFHIDALTFRYEQAIGALIRS